MISLKSVPAHHRWFLPRLLLPLFACFTGLVYGQEAALPGEPYESAPDAEGFIRLFDGKTLSGWKASENGKWQIEDGVLVGSGKRTHLFSPKTYRNFVFRADFMTRKGTNSGQYFRATYVENGWPKGYEAQVNNTHKDPRKTGSLYGICDVHEQLVKDDEWWTQEVTCVGNHIVIKVNGKPAVDFVDPENRYTEGHLAFQQHDPGSLIRIRNVKVKPLPDDYQLPAETAR